jgi:hypothetical protein
MEEVE